MAVSTNDMLISRILIGVAAELGEESNPETEFIPMSVMDLFGRASKQLPEGRQLNLPRTYSQTSDLLERLANNKRLERTIEGGYTINIWGLIAESPIKLPDYIADAFVSVLPEWQNHWY